MRLIIAGTRTIVDYKMLKAALKQSPFDERKITAIISGGAKGVDALAIKYARKKDIPLQVCKADWNQFGNAAGPIRNSQMSDIGNALLAVWDGRSKGTSNMITTAQRKGLCVFVYEIKEM